MDNNLKMEDTKKIIIIDNIDLAKANLARIRNVLDDEKACVIAMSDPVFLFLKGKGINCRSHCDFEKEGMYEDVYPTAYKWGRNWYKPKGSDLTSEGAYSMGEMIEWSMIYFFSHFLRYYLSIGEIIKQICPEEVLYFIPSGKNIIKDPDALQVFDAELLSYLISEYISNKSSNMVFRTVQLSGSLPEKKRQYLLRKIFSLVNMAVSEMLEGLNVILRKKKKMLFFEGARHFRLIMKDRSIRSYDRIHLEKTIGPALLPDLYMSGIRVATLDLRKRPSVRTAPNRINAAKKELAGFFMYGNEDLLKYMWPRIEFLLNEFLPEVVASDISTVERAIGRIKPDCVVAENDTTYYEKIVVFISKQKGISTVVVQNGNTLYGNACKNKELVFHPFFPLSADKFFAFGEASKDWFISMGVDGDRIIVTGASRFDDHYDGKFRERGRRDIRRRRVLVIMSDIWNKEGVVTHHIALSVFLKDLSEFISFAKRNPDVDVVIRPHDHHHGWNEVLENELKDADNVVISNEDKLEHVFLRTDLVIGYPSTALIEALMYDIPVLSIDTGLFNNYLPLWEYNLAGRITGFGELDHAVKGLLYDSSRRETAIRKIKDNLGYFIYKNDGMATQRIAGELNKMGSG